eukprot:TRINITY_DN13248_c0_g1_i2.p1 TRINITY_DN13248_c0_g1~~TRINITY_DN13248_c0_g1_i2.p1  ORF type:complete len:509 (+),score=109.33 TRINITY_DN13248_c0_g1_i2:79-1605(+)
MKFSCDSKELTLQWMREIVLFLRQYEFIWRSHVVDFFCERLWESVDREWMECLRQENAQNLLLLPSGFKQEKWPTSLKAFLEIVRLLSFPRDTRATLEMVESLAAVIERIVNKIHATNVIDVGAGQGYLSQVLSFKYGLSVVSLDASAHNGSVTSGRAERIQKHYKSKRALHMQTCNQDINIPRTVTCEVLHSASLIGLTKALSSSSSSRSLNTGITSKDTSYKQKLADYFPGDPLADNMSTSSSFVLAGLHACGDLSVTMLRTFLECKDVKAVISIGCCYNLLSEQSKDKAIDSCGFPLSKGMLDLDLYLGRSGLDLACQSAERWSSLKPEDAKENFQVHACRAAFQMLLKKRFPEILAKEGFSVGRLGKAQRRKKKKSNSSHNKQEEQSDILLSLSNNETASSKDSENRFLQTMFKEYTSTATKRLSLPVICDEEIVQTWNEVEQNLDLIGPYWSLRATFGPLLETLLLLDRLFFLQENNVMEAILVPLFNPHVSPRNMALIAYKQ